MPKAGILSRSVSKRAKPAETRTDITHHSNAVQTSSNVQPPQPHAGFGHRLYSDEIVIGLAIGSPRQSRILALSPDDRDDDVSYVCSSPENPVVPVTTLGNVYEIVSGGKCIKRKESKWKSLGSFFGRKEVRSASPFYQLGQNQRPEWQPAKQIITQDQLDTNALRRKRADSNHGSKANHLDPSTGMLGEQNNGLLRRTSSRRRGLRRRKVEESQPEMQRVPVKCTAHAVTENWDFHGERQSRIPGPSLLQVEIPCVELERYSVMFGDVLKPQTRQSKPQPSLLARRQPHSEELHAIAASNDAPFDLDLPNPGMRVDSISFKVPKSPSFSLFPSAPPHSARSPVNQLLLKPGTLSRSVTESNHRLFPPKPAIKESKSQDQEHLVVSDIPENPTPHDRQLSLDLSQRSADSTTASFFECAEYPGHSYPPIEVDTPTQISTIGATQESLHRVFPERKSSMKKLAPSESRYRGHRRHGEDAIDPNPEVSVARQVSISRRQHQLLVPIAPKTARRPIQPRINEQSTTDESRKSHHSTLEDA